MNLRSKNRIVYELGNQGVVLVFVSLAKCRDLRQQEGIR
jgi:hypothetical protein